MCCIENELVNEARFANTPFFFAVKGRISSVTDVMSQQTDWQRVIHFHNADGEELRVVDGIERLKLSAEVKRALRRSARKVLNAKTLAPRSCLKAKGYLP